MKAASLFFLLVIIVSLFQTGSCRPVIKKLNEPDAEVTHDIVSISAPLEVTVQVPDQLSDQVPSDQVPVSIPPIADEGDPTVLKENEIKVEARHHHHHHGIPHLGWIIFGVIFGIIVLAWWGLGALCNACGCKETAQGCWSCGEGCLQCLAICGSICSCCQSCDDPCCTDTCC